MKKYAIVCILASLALAGCIITPTPVPVPPTPTPVPVPVPVPPAPVVTNPPPVVTTGQVRGVMFMPAKVPQAPWIQVGPPWPDSTQAYARSHGKSWENDYRHWLVTAVSSWGGDTVVFFGDALYGAIELEMYLCDTASPVDAHHIADADNSAVWLANAGITRHGIILSDSPPPWNLPGGSWDKYIADLSKAYATARGITHLWIIGLECNRNAATDAPSCAIIAGIIRKYEPGARIIAGSASLDFLKAVHAADAGIELWKETDGHPINAALTTATAGTFIAELDQLAALVGAGKVWAGEWYSQNDMLAITAQITARGMNCGCGRTK